MSGTLAQQLRAARKPPSEAWQPEIFAAGDDHDCMRLEALLARRPTLTVIDTLPAQLEDLARVELRRKQPQPHELQAAIERTLQGRAPEAYGNWIHYPWLDALVHLLPEPAFRRLRWDRNQYKITPAEQRLLASKTILVVGLSVGRSALLNLVQEGVGTQFHLCDYDHLDVSNLNRLRGSVAQIGTSKVVLAAREIFEQDPYLGVTIHPDGVSAATLTTVFPDTIDLLVEECDDLSMKVLLRERARALRVPVVMDTSDRGMLDIERFDLEPDRPVFHGLVDGVAAQGLQGLTTRERVPFVLRILDAERLSLRLSASLAEVEESIYTWPQLASSVSLGGALVCDAARRVLLGSLRASGRYYVDLDDLVQDGAAVALPAQRPVLARPASEAQRERTLPELPRRSSEQQASREELTFLVAHAIWAPSGGNSQPWRFHARAGGLDCLLDSSARSFLDFEGWGDAVALGAAVENIRLAAPSVGLRAQVAETPGDGARVARIELSRAEVEDLPLRRYIAERATNRRSADSQPLAAEKREQLVRRAEQDGLCLSVLHGAKSAELARALGEVDRLRALIEPYHRDLFAELRWTPDEVVRTRTGIDLHSLELSAADMAGLSVLRRWPVAEFMQREGLGAALRTSAARAFAGCQAAILLSAPRALSPFEAGQRLQRFWLAATELRLALQPWLPIVPMTARAQHGRDLAVDECAAIQAQAARLHQLWALPADQAPLFIGRVLDAPPAPSARSLRLPVERVLRV